MVIPSDTAKPLNSFLKSGLTLKLSVLFSLSAAPSAAGPSFWLPTNRHPLQSAPFQPSYLTNIRIRISVFLASQKTRNI